MPGRDGGAGMPGLKGERGLNGYPGKSIGCEEKTVAPCLSIFS